MYVRHATKAHKIVVDLGTAHNRELIWSQCTSLTILDKGTGAFTLTVIFPDQTELELLSSEILNGDVFSWDIMELRITNTAQEGVTAKFIVEQQVL